MATPNVLLVLCFVVGSGMALMGPAWQSSVSEQVPLEAQLPAAVALNGISYNIARSVGPAIGGVVVASAGAVAAFALNTLLYLPLIAALFLWKRVSAPSRLPPERLSRAMVSGVRYISNSPSIKVVLLRTLVTGVGGGAITALMPLVVRDVLHGDAQTYGIMLGAFGLGAVVGALNIAEIRRRMSGEAAIRACALSMGAAMAAVALSRQPVLTAAALVLAGAVWMLTWAVFNIGVQLSAPRWVTGRSLAAYQAASSGGIAVGSWAWGHLTDAAGVETALLVAAVLMLASPLIGRWLPMPRVGARGEEAELLADPEVRLALTGRSGTACRRDRIPDCAGECPRVSQRHARRAIVSPAQRRLWLVNRARHCRSRIMDRALSLSDLVRLLALAQPLDPVGTYPGTAGNSVPHRPCAGTRAPHAGEAIRLGTLEGRHARACDGGNAAGDGKRGKST
ncbi:putative MFS family arabinose efflux permease [Bradyrhizobium sp. JR6.1]